MKNIIVKEDWRWFLLALILFLLMSTNVKSQEIDTASVRAEIIKQGVLFPDIVLAQSVKETGWYKCTNCCLDGNNLFGFYWKKKYKSWNTWKESVKYYADWQKRHYKGGDYFEFLKKVGYASDPRYIQDLKNTYPLKIK